MLQEDLTMTPQAGLRKQIEIYRGMTGQQRLLIGCELYETARALVRQGVLHQHRDWDEARVEQEVLRRFQLAASRVY
jgi:hypothetical protein